MCSAPTKKAGGMMSRKRSKPTYTAIIEELSKGVSEAEKTSETHNQPDDEMVEKTLTYIGQKCLHTAKICQQNSTASSSRILQIIQELELARYAGRRLVDYAALPETVTALAEKEQLKDVLVFGQDGMILLKLELFPLVAHPIKGAYNAYYSVKKAVMEHIKTQPNQLDPRERYTLVYQRIVAGSVRLSAGCCDNDNFEMQRVTNAITETIGIADSADKFSFYYTTTSGQYARTLVYLVREKDLAALLNDNKFKTPKLSRNG